jgi:hypothetical protein
MRYFSYFWAIAKSIFKHIKPQRLFITCGIYYIFSPQSFTNGEENQNLSKLKYLIIKLIKKVNK